MKKVFDKWENLNIKYKLFSITTGLLIVLAIIIYLILYLLLPSYYHKYKIDILQNNINSIIKTSKHYDTEHLKERIYYLSKSQNLSIMLRDSSGRILYGKNELVLSKYSKYILGNIDNEEYRVNIQVHTNDNILPYTLDVIMPLQPIDEASDVIRRLMPYILMLALLIGAIGAYIYSKVITKPLIEIIEKEREEENNRKEFVATISHELKTPITIISGQLEGMIYNIGKYKDRDTYLRKSYESTQELKDLVNEMLEVSKSEIHSTDLKITNVNLSELLNKLVERQRFLIDEKNIETVLQIKDGIYAYCDGERIEKAINNIINNGIKYSPENEKLIVRLYERKVKSSLRSTKPRIYLEIENTGITIEKKYLSEIFKPFYRLEKSRSRKTGGSGLGLYLTSQILKSHGYYHTIRNKENSVIFILEIKQ